MQEQEFSRKQLRSFGLMVGGIFLLIGLWPALVRGQDPRVWAVIIAASLILPALVLPTSLRRIYQIWMMVGHVLGWINTKIILSIIFYVVFTPVGLVMRLMGRDPMHRKFDHDADSYRVARVPRPGSHMRHQF